METAFSGYEEEMDVKEITEWFIMQARLNNSSGDHDIMNPENYELCEKEIDRNGEILRNALKAYADPDTIVIKRSELEGMKKEYTKNKSANISRGCYNLAINDVLALQQKDGQNE